MRKPTNVTPTQSEKMSRKRAIGITVIVTKVNII